MAAQDGLGPGCHPATCAELARSPGLAGHYGESAPGPPVPLLIRERTIPVTSQALVTALGLAAHPDKSLRDACGADPGIACRLTWNVTHSQTAAQLVNVWLARPVALVLQIILVLLVAIVIRLIALRLINKITKHAAEAGNGKTRPGARADGRAAAAARPGPRVGAGQRGVGAHLRHRRGDHRR